MSQHLVILYAWFFGIWITLIVVSSGVCDAIKAYWSGVIDCNIESEKASVDQRIRVSEYHRSLENLDRSKEKNFDA